MTVGLTRRGLLAAGLGTACLPTVSLAEPPREFQRGGMTYRRLGQTGLDVSLLSLGSHTDPTFKRKVQFGNVLSEEGQARRDRLAARALDLGVNLIDTYESEGQWEPVARLVKPRRSKVLVSVCRQFPMFVGENIDRAAELYGYVDLYRIYVGDGTRVEGKILEDWDVLRKAKEAGKVRAIGISTHSERMMTSALYELEGLDYIIFQYNFIHARADYAEFLPAAIGKGVGLIGMKPLAAGSIVRLDPRARSGPKPENERIELYQSRNRAILPAVVAELTRSLNRLPDETLCQAALRYVYSRPFLTTALTGMFDESLLQDNYAALVRREELRREEHAALNSTARWARTRGAGWLPRHYRWLEERWRG